MSTHKRRGNRAQARAAAAQAVPQAEPGELQIQFSIDYGQLQNANTYDVRQSPHGIEVSFASEVLHGLSGDVTFIQTVTLMPVVLSSGLTSNRASLETTARRYAHGTPPNDLVKRLEHRSGVKVATAVSNATNLTISVLGGLCVFAYISPAEARRRPAGGQVPALTTALIAMPADAFGHFYLDLMKACDELASRIPVEFPYLMPLSSEA